MSSHPHRSSIRVPRALWREARRLIEEMEGVIDARCYTDAGEKVQGRVEAWLAAVKEHAQEPR